MGRGRFAAVGDLTLAAPNGGSVPRIGGSAVAEPRRAVAASVHPPVPFAPDQARTRIPPIQPQIQPPEPLGLCLD